MTSPAPVNQRRFNHRDAPVPPNCVLAPGGYRDKSLVRKIKRGFFLRRRNGEIQHVERITQRIHRREPLPDPNAVHPQIGSGWIAYAEWRRPDGNQIHRLYTEWTVPNPPSTGDTGQSIFLFNGLQNEARNEIIQPVLQWGSSALGGGAGHWWIGNWHVGPSGLMDYKGLVPVEVNDTLTGVITLVSQPQGKCSYVSQFVNYPGIDLFVPGIDELTWVCQTLEAYKVSSDADYPASDYTSMSSIELDMVGAGINPVSWDAQTPMAPDQTVQISNRSNPGGEVDIFYHA